MAATDNKPTDFVLKVYETKALAEEGEDNNALFVFHNGISDGNSADPAIGNASQVISSSTTSFTNGKLVDTSAKFGSRLAGKRVYNTESILDPRNKGYWTESFVSAVISSVDSETQLTIDTDIFKGTAIKTLDNLSPGIDGADQTGAWEYPPSVRYLVAQTSTSGSGTGAVFHVVLDNNGVVRFVMVQRGGTGYAIDDTVVLTDPGSTSNTFTVTVASLSGSIKYWIESPGNFFTFQKYFYRLESSDPVTGFVIDWDDGEDNSPEKANRQTVKLDSPRTYVVVSHTYTTHGKHYPMIRTISMEGFTSKWYTTADANTAGLDSIETQTLTSGQNDYSVVSIDSATRPRIPEFMPANSPPVGVLKIDRSWIYSCIDNDVINGDAISNPELYFYIDRAGATDVTLAHGLEVTWEDTGGNIITQIVSASSDSATNYAACEIVGGTADSGLYVKRLLGVKIINLSEGTTSDTDTLAPDERVYCYVSPNTGTRAPASDPVVTIVSLGNPIQYLNRPGFSVMADGSQSQTRCSNISIDKYIYDEGKLKGANTTTGAADYTYTTAWPNQVSDILGDTSWDPAGLSNDRDQSDSHSQFYYTHSPVVSPLTDNCANAICSKTKRFFDEERLIRLQVTDDSINSRADSTVLYADNYKTVAILSATFSTSATTMSVSDGSVFTVGEIISVSATATNESLKVTGITDDTLTVTRQYNGATAIAGSQYDSIYKLYDGGKLGDTCTHSFIEHWDLKSYNTHINRPDTLKSKAYLAYGTAWDPSNDINAIDIKWKTINQNRGANDYKKQTRAVGATATNAGEEGVIFGGIGRSDAQVSNVTQLATNTFEGGKGNRSHEKANNFLLMCKDKKFDRAHFRMKNEFVWSLGTNNPTSDIMFASEKVQLMAWYTARTSPTAATYEWKPLPFIDTTSVRTYDTNDSGPDENTSLRRSGSIVFDAPVDWVKVDSNDLSWDGAAKPVSAGDEDALAPNDPEVMWSEKMYGILVGIAVDDGSDEAKYKCIDVQTYNNSHSTTINVVDPHHKSLNNIAIAQSISWNRAGNYMSSTTRAGRTEIKKMGAAGGNISFGGIELTGDYDNQKKALNIYQREGTPVYLDVQREKTTEYIRFYGVITSMSEDYPAGKMIPKFGLNMVVSYICEYGTGGEWIGRGLQSLGGEVLDVPKYT
jgi:hypothetical protein